MGKHRRCAFCNSVIHYGASFIGFNPEITVTINGCRELVRKADFSTHLHSPNVFCSTDESVFPLVFDADHKRFLCFDCLERFINKHYSKRDDWDDNEDEDDY